MTKLATALRDARIASGMMQRDVADILGISAAFLSDLEHGRRVIGLKHISKLPPPIRDAVAAAWVADRESEIATLKELLI